MEDLYVVIVYADGRWLFFDRVFFKHLSLAKSSYKYYCKNNPDKKLRIARLSFTVFDDQI